MRVGEVAERAGVNVETLRYYERRGLLPEPERMPSGHRRYDEETVRFLRAIKEAQSVGFTLAEIGDYLGAARRSGSPSETLRVRMAAKIDEIDARIAGLRRMRDELARVVGCACDSLDHCTCGAAYLARRGRETSAPPALLHVTNGESAGNTLRQTGLGGAVLPWQDVLHDGPVPDCLARPSCFGLARRSSPSAAGAPRSTIRSSLERRDRQLREALRDGRSLVLWFEHDLYDQLQLLDVLALAHGLEGSLESIVVDDFPGKPSFRGLGELTPDELETLWPARREVTAETLAEAAAAWAAFRAPEPVALAELAVRGSEELPFLAPRSSVSSRSCRESTTGCPGPSGRRSRRSPAKRARRWARSWPRRTWKRRRSSATRGSTGRSPRSGRATRGCSRPRRASLYPRRRRSATGRNSRGSCSA